VANYIKDITITAMALIRTIYFTYVLYRVCKKSQNIKAFISRPVFMNWLPILIFAISITSFAFGSLLLYETIQGGGKVICQLYVSDLVFMVFGYYFTGICHYLFTAEFLNTLVALKAIIEGLKLSSSNIVDI
jgi:hypothetical protein